jgi:hypothetical protein
VDGEILHASVQLDDESSRSDQFRDKMVAFSEHAAAELRACQSALDAAVAALKTMVTFFGEKWDNQKPQSLFKIVADFLVMFDKTVAEVRSKTRLMTLPFARTPPWLFTKPESQFR